jgi:3-deoxy-D-manno-octulosonate 8-phosphate phosphatase (KDO 8-P phosphatase)
MADAPSAELRAQPIRMLALDVDGTMTDGRIYIGPQGESFKAFSVHDGFGLTLLRQAGVKLAVITGRESKIVEQRAAELKFDAVMQGVSDKGDALSKLARQFGLAETELAFMGDDWPDLPAMRRAGLAACVAHAAPEVRAAAHWVSQRPAGDGAVREFALWWLTATGKLDNLRQTYLAGQS